MPTAAQLARALPPWASAPARRLVRWYRRRLAPGSVRMGRLGRPAPIEETLGVGRGGPVDRVYIDEFVARHASDIAGRVLEVKSARYASQLGDPDEIVVVDIDPNNRKASVIADLCDAPQLADDSFDCVLLTQVLQLVDSLERTIATTHRCLRPGGVVLATMPGITRLSPIAHEREHELWRLTALSARRLFAASFGTENVEVTSYGNVLTAAAMLYGLGLRDLKRSDIAVHDPSYEVILGVRAVKK